MMNNWLLGSALDARFVDLAIFVSVTVWPWLIATSFGGALIAWKLVLVCQAIALPFSVLGWVCGFRAGRRMGFTPRGSAMLAGWVGLLVAEFGLGIVLSVWFGRGQWIIGLWALPALVVLVSVGVLWFYRRATWARWELWNEGMAT